MYCVMRGNSKNKNDVDIDDDIDDDDKEKENSQRRLYGSVEMGLHKV